MIVLEKDLSNKVVGGFYVVFPDDPIYRDYWRDLIIESLIIPK